MPLRTPAPDWFEVPNSFVDEWLPRLYAVQIRAMLIMFRRERGYPAVVGISSADLAVAIGLTTRRAAHEVLLDLLDLGLVDGDDERGWYTKGAVHV